MIFLVFFWIVIPLLVMIWSVKEGFGFISVVFTLLVFLIGTLGIAVFGVLPGEYLYEKDTDMTMTDTTKYELTPMDEDNTYIYQYFENSQTKYVYTTPTEKGNLSSHITNTYAYVIAIPNGEEPYVIHKKNNFNNFFLKIMFFCPEEYFIYVPEGNIKVLPAVD